MSDNRTDHSSNSDYRNRSPQHVRADRKRQRELDWEDTRLPAWVAWVSVLCLIVLFLGFIMLANSDRTNKPMNVNGDQLGPLDVSAQQYAGYAKEQLDKATGDEPRWALVSPDPNHWWTVDQLTEILKGVDARVSTFYLGPGTQRAVAEPAVGHTRADVIRQVAEGVAQRAQIPVSDVRFDGVLVYATPSVLRELAKKVYAVEPAHPDAAYGRIGIRPIGAA